MWQITFQDVSMYFDAKQVLTGLTRTVRGGSITAVTGANGSGKSTFLRLAGHLQRPTMGKVTVTQDGQELRRAALRQALGMVTPELRFYPRFTAWENMVFLLGLRGRELTQAEYEASLAQVGLAPAAVAHTYTGEFSTGMRQRLKLAVLFLSGAGIWLLDEPGANLDTAGRAMVLAVARQAADAGKLVLLATNDPGEEAAADAIIHL